MDSFKEMVFVLILSVHVLVSQALDTWTPTSMIQCRTNDDCQNYNHCCSITPALGKREIQERQIPPNWDGTVHYCLPWKNENATWCELRLQYAPEHDNYFGLCPCGPGLVCTPTQELDEKHYPRDRFGKCTKATSTS